MALLRCITIAATLSCVGCAVARWERQHDALLAMTGSTQERVTIPNHHLPDVKLGVTLDELRETLRNSTHWQYYVRMGIASDDIRYAASLEDDPLSHAFTIERGGSKLLCVRCVVIVVPVYFLFRDGLLDKIVEYPPPEYGMVHSENLRARVKEWMPVDPQELPRRLLDGPGLSTDEFRTQIKHRSESALTAKLRGMRYMEANPALEVASTLSGILSNLMLRRSPTAQWRSGYRQYVKLEKKYNGFRVRLGMTQEMVDEILGPPRHSTIETDGTIVREYAGDPVKDYGWEAPVVVVKFKGDQAIAVLSRSFARAAP